MLQVLRAIALVTRSLGTMLGIMALRAGMSKAMVAPLKNA